MCNQTFIGRERMARESNSSYGDKRGRKENTDLRFNHVSVKRIKRMDGEGTACTHQQMKGCDQGGNGWPSIHGSDDSHQKDTEEVRSHKCATGRKLSIRLGRRLRWSVNC
jgi:hypothetical protein